MLHHSLHVGVTLIVNHLAKFLRSFNAVGFGVNCLNVLLDLGASVDQEFVCTLKQVRLATSLWETNYSKQFFQFQDSKFRQKSLENEEYTGVRLFFSGRGTYQRHHKASLACWFSRLKMISLLGKEVKKFRKDTAKHCMHMCTCADSALCPDYGACACVRVRSVCVVCV